MWSQRYRLKELFIAREGAMQLSITDLFRYTNNQYGLRLPVSLFEYRRLKLEFFTTNIAVEDPVSSLNFASPYNQRMVLQFQFLYESCRVIAFYGYHNEPEAINHVVCVFDSYQTEIIKDAVYKLCPWMSKFRGDGLHLA